MTDAALKEIGWSYDGFVTDECGFPCVVDHDNMAVCSVLDDGIDDVQQVARCHLIAAAPALLERAEYINMTAVRIPGLPDEYAISGAALRLLLEAIAKATGQQNAAVGDELARERSASK